MQSGEVNCWTDSKGMYVLQAIGRIGREWRFGRVMKKCTTIKFLGKIWTEQSRICAGQAVYKMIAERSVGSGGREQIGTKQRGYRAGW